MAEKDALMAKHLKDRGITPPKHWPCDSAYATMYKLALKMGKVGGGDTAKWRAGMLGGVLAFKAGLSSINPIQE